jgi:PmbA protein
VRGLEGPVRHAAALGVPAKGTCSSRWVAPGSLGSSDLSGFAYLEALVFSDFFMDATSGEFGGELRLAALHSGSTVTPVTGGSIAGSIAAEAAGLRFSAETARREAFIGPASVLLSLARVTSAG